MANGSLTLTEWRDKAERAKASLAKLRDAGKSALVHARYDFETIGAGTVAGAIRGAFQATGKAYAIPTPGGGPSIPPEVPAGLLCLAIAFSEQTDVSRDFHALGSGVLAYSGGREAEAWMSKRQNGRRNGG